MSDTTKTTLDMCQGIMDDRSQSYGDVCDGFQRASEVAKAMGIEISPKGIALVQVALKISRNMHSWKRDNIIDAINYLAIAHELHASAADELANVRL